jgi:uncharacterized membrane protein
VKSADEEVKSYLKELERDLSPLPRRRRKEVVQEISTHIAESRQELGSDHPIADVLDRVGDPQTIAWEVMQGEPGTSHASRGLEVAAIIFLLPGSLLLPVVGWLVGVVLLWASSIWTTKDKLIGTLVVPGGLLLSAVLPLMATRTCSGSTVNGRIVNETCSSSAAANLWIAVWILSIVGSIGAGIYLGSRLRRGTIPSPQIV